jgi:hypothetical protein
MATQLTIVNNILRRLREDEVTSVADNVYSKLIGQFVNDAKADIEDVNHEWSAYVTSYDTTILADSSTRTYDLTSTNDRSWLIRGPDNDYTPAAYDITSTENAQLTDIPYKTLLQTRALNTSATAPSVVKPRFFAVTSDSDGRGWTLELLWALDSTASARTWRTYWYVPQADLALDGTDNSTEIKLPARPVELMAFHYAINERGEEMGQPGSVSKERATLALAAALETDMQVQKQSELLDITNKERL